MAGVVFWTKKRRKRLRVLAAKGLSARKIALRFATVGHAPTAEGVRDMARRFGIALVNRGGRPKRRRGARKRKGKRA